MSLFKKILLNFRLIIEPKAELNCLHWADFKKLEKAAPDNFLERFREIVSDPINLKIRRVPQAGFIDNDMVILHNGHRVPRRGRGSYYESFTDILIINRGVHEPLEEYCFQEVLAQLAGRADTMIELGSYWAHYSMWFLKLNQKAQSILVDSDLENLNAGRENFSRNGYQGEFIQSFVGAGKFSVDGFMTERGLRKIDILHADLQGFELEMLNGASSALLNHQIDYIFISTHSEDLHRSVLTQLACSGYRVEISSNFGEETTSYDGFILASAPQCPTIWHEWKPPGRLEIINPSRENNKHLET